MNKELYVSSTPHETKVALVEDDQLAEVFFERENRASSIGCIGCIGSFFAGAPVRGVARPAPGACASG